MKSCSDHVMGVPLQRCPNSECRLTCVRMQWVTWTKCVLWPLLAVSCGVTGLGLFTLTVSSPRMECRIGQKGKDEWLVDSCLETSDRGSIQCTASGEDVSEARICTRPWVKLGCLLGWIDRANPDLRTRGKNDWTFCKARDEKCIKDVLEGLEGKR
jgi:hypothetical protein